MCYYENVAGGLCERKNSVRKMQMLSGVQWIGMSRRNTRPGGKGSGSAFVRNAEMLKKVFITMVPSVTIRKSIRLPNFFGHTVSLPVYAAPISGILQNYGAELDDMSYTRALVDGSLRAGTLAFTGDGMHDEMFQGPMSVVKEHDGYGVPTIKPWSKEHMAWRIQLAKEAMHWRLPAILMPAV